MIYTVYVLHKDRIIFAVRALIVAVIIPAVIAIIIVVVICGESGTFTLCTDLADDSRLVKSNAVGIVNFAVAVVIHGNDGRAQLLTDTILSLGKEAGNGRISSVDLFRRRAFLLVFFTILTGRRGQEADVVVFTDDGVATAGAEQGDAKHGQHPLRFHHFPLHRYLHRGLVKRD